MPINSKLILMPYIITKALTLTYRVEIMNKNKFVKIELNENIKTFKVYIYIFF